MRTIARYGFILLVVLLTACQELPRYFTGDKVLATVGDKDLELRELREMLPTDLDPADSAAYARVYVDRWVRRQLKLQEAEQLFSSSEADIDRQVEEYRQTLLIRKLDQFYVDRMVDTTFTDDQIADYYAAHSTDHRLDHTIVQGAVVRLPKNYLRRTRLKELMGSEQEARRQDFVDMCLKQEFELHRFEGQWVDWADFLMLLPTLRAENYDKLLTKSGVQEMTDKQYLYLFRIDRVLREGDPMPLEQLRQTIRRVLFKQRQQEILRQYEQTLYESSLEQGLLKLYDEETTPDEAAAEDETQKN